MRFNELDPSWQNALKAEQLAIAARPVHAELSERALHLAKLFPKGLLTTEGYGPKDWVEDELTNTSAELREAQLWFRLASPSEYRERTQERDGLSASMHMIMTLPDPESPQILRVVSECVAARFGIRASMRVGGEESGLFLDQGVSTDNTNRETGYPSGLEPHSPRHRFLGNVLGLIERRDGDLTYMVTNLHTAMPVAVSDIRNYAEIMGQNV